MQITVEIPDDLAPSLAPGRDPSRAVLQTLGLEAYRLRRITGYQLRTLLGLPSRWDLQDLATIEEFRKKRKAGYAGMIVVADASPLRYLVGIGVVDVLNSLYGRVLVPVAVAGELQDAKTPATVRAWIAHPPTGCEIRPDPPFDPALGRLDAGERSAIALALLVPADVLLMDEWNGRAEAKCRRLLVTGTLGVLADAHLAGLLDFETALAQLRITNFYISEDVIAGIRQRLSRAANKGWLSA